MNIDQKIIFNVLDDETKSFFEKYSEVKKINFPDIKSYNKILAETKSKKQAFKEKEGYLTMGILITVISFIVSFCIALSDAEDNKELSILSNLGVVTGGIITFVQLSSKTKYNDSQKAKVARTIKNNNEINLKKFYNNCFNQAQEEYHRHTNFLNTNPSSEDIDQYSQQECISSIDRAFFDQIILTKIQKLKQKQEAEASLRTLSSVAGIGLKVAEIHELNQIGNALDDIGNALEDFA